jgi:hypothetical protein
MLRSDRFLYRGVVNVKRLVTLAVLFVLTVPGGAAAAPGQTTVERFPVDFMITSASCPNLSAGATIEGSGTMHSVTRTMEREGITTVANSSTATGSATDQDGNSYQFVYKNRFSVANSAADPGLFSGVMHDLFLLRGSGPETLTNGFVAVFTTNFADVNQFDPISSFGDPIDFATGEARCDPL